uniref:Uncharacterized protein n=1 Tax=Anguilla anguilla TaxID=7936 RepID=A0A0E9XZ06_ANGAN
MKMHFFVRRFG